MSLMSSMNIAQQSLLVNQACLNTVSNNISNLNTVGYTRQRVDLTPGVNYMPIGGSVLGQVYANAGVDIEGITRYTDAYLLSYYRQQNCTNSYLQQSAQIATNIEGMVNELKGSGMEAAFSKFFEAAQTLSLTPTNVTARQNYIQQAQTIALKFNSMATDFQEVRTSLVGDPTQSGTLETSNIYGLISQANTKLQQIAAINEDIVKVSSGDLEPNSLLDKRDQLINELSAMMPINVVNNTNGTLNISVNGVELIRGTEKLGSLNVISGDDDNPAIVRIIDNEGASKADNINDYIDTGTIGAVLDMGSSRTDILTAKSALLGLDKLANGFATIINNIQTAVDAGGTPLAMDRTTNQLITATENIFKSSTGGAISASNIQINSLIMANPDLIAAARADIMAVAPPYDPKAVGNNNNMIKILTSRTSNSSDLDNTNPESYLAKMVGSVGLKVSTIKDNLKNQNVVLAQVQNQLSSITGVNLDEEIIDLSKFQRAYQASSRVFSVCNDLYDTLLNLGK